MSWLSSQLAERGDKVYFISAATGEGLDSLLDGVLQCLTAARSADQGRVETAEHEAPVLRPRPRREPVRIRKDDGTYVVAAPSAERIAAAIDAADWNARVQFYGYLRSIGVAQALEKAGVGPGDTVRIGKVEWEWE